VENGADLIEKSYFGGCSSAKGKRKRETGLGKVGAKFLTKTKQEKSGGEDGNKEGGMRRRRDP